MHGAGGGAPRGNRNALKHGEFTAEGFALKKQISALSRIASRREFPEQYARVREGLSTLLRRLG
jgi:hypothetical protein